MAITWLASVVTRRIEGKRKISVVNLTTSGSGNTYTTGGDAPPSFGDLGMKRNVEVIRFFDTSQEGYLYTWDRTNNKIKIFKDELTAADAPLTQVDAATAFNSKSVFVEVVGF